jgi:hypothetical protein
MGKSGAVFDAELIELMKSALDGAVTLLPRANRTTAMKVSLAYGPIAPVLPPKVEESQLVDRDRPERL